MRIEHQAEVLVRARCPQDEFAELGQDAPFPIRRVADVATVEMRHEIERLVATRFEVVDGMHEGADADGDGMPCMRVVEEILALAEIPEGLPIEARVALRVQFRDQVVVAKPGLGRGHPHEADRRKRSFRRSRNSSADSRRCVTPSVRATRRKAASSAARWLPQTLRTFPMALAGVVPSKSQSRSSACVCWSTILISGSSWSSRQFVTSW
jgi:hypothetical protein